MEELEQIRFNIITLHNDGISLREIAKRLEIGLSKCSPTTIYRIRKSLNFDYKPPRIRQSLNEIQIAKRLLFALDHKSNKTDWTRILYLKNVRNLGKKILIWGGISYYLQTELIVIEKSVNTETYINDIIKKFKGNQKKQTGSMAV
ncbi:transposable element tc3 transposase-like protein [Anaeramoeba flamelloides]|uniref:Transposable element tc3 transposase-like protein n=1 Tax=Anaeramoeba flamelloides TaxID=1746091 RepID=A0AAV7Z6M4_9EUKA|nr:transposable element tc3 transposase-like protein [Anaeramoeba flamelloides]